MGEKDGGSAFPKYVGGNRDLAPGEEAGMSLRDYFAGQALSGMTATMPEMAKGTPIASIAHDCYLAADAMIAERAK